MSGRLTRLQLDGLKGVLATHDLPGPVILSGPNGCGKTALLEAVRLALAGPLAGVHVERLARRFAGAGGTIRAEDASGEWIERGVRLKGESGEVRELLELSGVVASAGMREKGARAGDAWRADPVALDLGELLKIGRASCRERV